MSVLAAFRYCMRLMLDEPSSILPSLVIIFLVSVVLNAAIIAVLVHFNRNLTLFRFGSLSLLIDLVISLVVGIFLSGYYVGLVKHHAKGRFSLGRAMKELDANKGKLGWIGSAILVMYAFLLGGAFFALYYGFYILGMGSAWFYPLALLAVVLIAVYFYFSVLFYEINLVLMVEGLSGIEALRRSARLAKGGNMLAIFAAIILIGLLYAAIYYGFGALAQSFHGIARAVLAYASIMPDAIATTIFDLMPPAMYYKHVMGKGRR